MIFKKNGVKGLTLLEAVLDIIIAVLIIIILFYVFSAVFGIFFGDKQKAQATGQLDDIMRTLQAVKLTGDKFGFLLQNPTGWRFVSFVNGANDNAKISLSCGSGNCVCICPKPTFGKANCPEGQCKVIDYPLVFNDAPFAIPIEIKDYCIQLKNNKFVLTEGEKCDSPTNLNSLLAEKRSLDKISGVMESASTHNINAKFSDTKRCECGTECKNYANLILQNSESNEIPDALLVVAIMIQESSCKADFKTASSFGLLGIGNIVGWENPETNIAEGIKKLKSSYDLVQDKPANYDPYKCGYKYEDAWQRAVRGYKGYECSDLNYADDVFERYSQLVQVANKQTVGQ
ncbi:hypothetical protein HZA33_01655 [Candidatus Pacearchaeota archaeon]|nr:hypothetical protein [Candidatus Pacearchaeota archaeon]